MTGYLIFCIYFCISNSNNGMTNNSEYYWPPEDVKALRDRLTTRVRGEDRPMNQTDFGTLVGHYTQPTISQWEKAGCTSKRGCHDLDKLKARLDERDRHESDSESDGE